MFSIQEENIIGLVPICNQLNGNGGKLEPFKPGTYEEYDILENGRVKLVKQAVFHEPENKPSFVPFLPYEGTLIKNLNCKI